MNIRRFTRLVAELFKFTDTDIGRAMRTFRSPFQGVDLERFLQRAMENGTIEETETYDDMNRLWLLRAVGYPDQKGVVLSVIGISRLRTELSDGVDQRKRLLELAEPFAGDPLIVANPFTATVEFANRSAWRILGIPEVIEGSFSLSRLTPEWGDTTWLSWLSTMAPGSVNRRLDVSLLDKNGKLIVADLLTAVIQDDGANHVIIRIIENRDRVIALNEMKERARAIAASNRELEQFASIVAHDLRAPLRHLNQFSQFLIAELEDAASPNVREYLNIIQSSSVNMSGMIERLLDYARLGTGEPVFAAVSLEECVNQASELLHGDLLEAGATLEVGNLSWVRGDRLLLIRLVQNLIMNSTKYRRRDRSLKIVVSTVVTDSNVILTVADNGIGIDEVHSQTIFKMFSRLQPDSEYTGFGMGLAICRRICEIHGGTISLDTSYDTGAKFDIVFKYAAGKDN
jgi:signal transduction histidine kinase